MRIERERDLGQLEGLLAGQLQAGPGGVIVFANGAEASDPLSWAAEARRHLGNRVRIFGFWCFENPEAVTAGEIRERIDFAVIDRRWLFDPWLRRFHSGDGAGFIDLEDQGAYAQARAIYGNPESWERDHDMECRADLQAGFLSSAVPAGALMDGDAGTALES